MVIHLKGKDLEAWAEFITELDRLEPVLEKTMAMNPGMASFMPFMGKNRRLQRSRLEAALEHGFGIVRRQLSDQAPL